MSELVSDRLLERLEAKVRFVNIGAGCIGIIIIGFWRYGLVLCRKYFFLFFLFNVIKNIYVNVKNLLF